MICLSKGELEELYKQAKRKELLETIVSKGYSLDDLQGDKVKMEHVVDVVKANHTNDKEEIEISLTLFKYLRMYPEGSEVCFVLKDNVDPRKNPISSFIELKAALKEGTLTDFGIMSEDGLRQFQLKQYRSELNTENLFQFIKKKLAHYGNDLGYVNLFVQLQSSGGVIDNIDFKELKDRIGTLGIKTDIEVLVAYNEADQFDVINCVYPTLATLRKERIVLD